MKKLWKSLVVFTLAFAMILSLLPASSLSVSAASKKKMKFAKAKVTMTVGQTKKLKVKRKPSKAKLTFKSANKKVATVSKKGVVKAVSAGTVKIKAIAKSKGKTYRATCKVTVQAENTATTPTTENKNQTTSTQEQSQTTPTTPTNTADEEYKNSDKVRTVVTTDGEVDDQDSFMRLMLYANEMKIEGIILTSSTYHYAGGTFSADDSQKDSIISQVKTDKDYESVEYTSSDEKTVSVGGYTENEDGTITVNPYRWTGTQWAYDVIDDYEEVYPNLIKNADGYPTADYLRSITKIGNINYAGGMNESTEGSDYLKELLLDDDDSPLYIQTWGGTNTTARALYDIEQEYKGTDQWEEIQQKIYKKVTLYIILNQDNSYNEYIKTNWPEITTIHDPGVFWRFAYMWKYVDSSLTTRLQGSWMYKNIVKGHGALLANYHTMGDGYDMVGELNYEQRGAESYLANSSYSRYDFISEGDSPSFFYLIDTGLRSTEDPSYGGWGGRFAKDPDETNTIYRPGSSGGWMVKEYYVADKIKVEDDTAEAGYTYKDDDTYILTRWFDDIQDDFAARADWCVSDYDDANHRPTITVDGSLDRTAKAGQRVKIKTSVTDPDGDDVTCTWWQYFEADTYDGASDGYITMTGENSDTMSFVVPSDAEAGDTIHMIIEAEDDGAHGMKHYQRVIITVTE